jgi:hypothetical protein
MSVPKDLDERARGIRSANLPVRLTVALRRSSRAIDLEVHVENRVLSHRLFNGFFDKDSTATLKFSRSVREAYLCDLREHRNGDVAFENNLVSLPSLGHCKFLTLFVRLVSAD